MSNIILVILVFVIVIAAVYFGWFNLAKTASTPSDMQKQKSSAHELINRLNEIQQMRRKYPDNGYLESDIERELIRDGILDSRGLQLDGRKVSLDEFLQQMQLRVRAGNYNW